MAVSTVGGVDTTYSYDDWGRTITRAMQDHLATMVYRYGDKLKRVDSNFPDETTVIQYLYDGFGKRRDRVVNNTVTWWRYDAGWNIIAEYDDPDLDWVLENQSRTYVPGLAEIMGADAATGAYRYYYTDNVQSAKQANCLGEKAGPFHTGAIRRMREQSVQFSQG